MAAGVIPMRYLAAFIILALVAGSVDAACFVDYQWCMNLTLKQSVTNDNLLYFHFAPKNHGIYYEGITPIYDAYGYNHGFTTNVLGEQMANLSLGNIYARVWNTSDSAGIKWNGPYRSTQFWGLDYGANPDWYFTQNTSIMWVNRTDHFGAAATGTPSILEVCLNGSMAGNIPVREPYAYPGGGDTWHIWNLFYGYPPCLGSAAQQAASCPVNVFYPVNFTKYYLRAWNYTDEQTTNPVNFTNKNGRVDIFCPSQGLQSVNLSVAAVWGNKTQIFITAEKAKYITSYNGVTYPREEWDRELYDRYYLNAPTPTAYTFSLVDYTGGFDGSLLTVKCTVNNTWVVKSSQTFDNDRTQTVNVEPNKYYSIQVTTPDEGRDLGLILLNNASYTKSVIVSGIYGDYSTRYDNSVNITTNFDSGQIACLYSTASGTNISYTSFRVQNYTSSGYLQLHISNLTTASGSLSYTVPNKNLYYIATCSIVNDNGTTILSNTENIFFRNTTAIMPGFNLNLPATIVGLSRSFIYLLIAGLTTYIVFSLFSQASAPIGAVTGVSTFGFFWYIGWVPTSTAGNLFYLFVFFAAFMMWSQKRAAVVT